MSGQTSMTLLEDINEEALRILREAIEPCVFLFFEDFFAINSDLDHPLSGVLLSSYDEAMPHIFVEGTGLHRTVKLCNWSQIMQNVLGIRFQEIFEVPVGALKSAKQIAVRGKIEDGPGKRLLFEALGRRTVTCVVHGLGAAVRAEILEGNPVSLTFSPKAVGVDFFSENPHDLQDILSKLSSVRGEIAKRQSLSMLKGDYAPYTAWAGIDPTTGKIINSATDKFNELFD
jgi:hypothetical protein